MLKSCPSRWIAGVVLTLVAAGCGAETFTYADDARAEGMRLYQAGNYVDAAAAFGNAAQQAPRDYTSLYYEGASFQAIGSYQQAIAAYRSVQAVQPLTLAGRRDNAIRYQTMDNLAQCIAKTKTGVADEVAAVRKRDAAQPNAGDEWYLAKIYRYSLDPDSAIEAYTAAVLLDPSRFDIAKEAGLYEEGLGQNQKAATTLKAAYADNQDDEQVNAALRRLGVVPGPSLMHQADLSHI